MGLVPVTSGVSVLMKLQSLIVVIALAVSGCATSPVPLSVALPVPADRLLAFQQDAPDTSATIEVVRDSGMMGGGCYTAFYISGVLAARINTGEKATFHLKPGEYVLRYTLDPQGRGLCHDTKHKHWTEHETSLRKGQTKHFRLSADANGKLDIQRAEGVAH